MKIVTAAQMVALEQACERNGISTDALMEQAGLAVAGAARDELSSIMHATSGTNVLVLVGPGNNGADGLVTARHLRRWGAEVAIYVISRRPDPDPKMQAALHYGVNVYYASDDISLDQFQQLLGRSRLVIDAVLGTGRARPLEGSLNQIAERLNSLRDQANHPLILAIDLPTGLNSDTGAVDPSGIVADLTVALGFPKVGLLTFPGKERVGRLKIVDIGLPKFTKEEEAVDLELLTPDWTGAQFPMRPLNSHKGTFGHLLVVAGSRNYVGAAFLVAQSAMRVGAGLVTLASPKSIYPILASKLTEVIHLPLPEDHEGRIHPSAVEVIGPKLDGYNALAVGPGMGWSESTTEFIGRLLLHGSPTELPTVVDADGLNNLSGLNNWWRRMPRPTVVTPHPGEMATLSKTSASDVQQDRVKSAQHWSRKWGITVVLKGANTIIAAPDGPTRVSPFANPGLASGGTGDVLTGIIGGLMAQGLTPELAGCCGVYIHGRAGEVVTQELGDAGTLATDLIQHLPDSIKWLENAAKPF